MSDKEISESVRAAADALNDAMESARMAGLTVDVQLIEVGEMQCGPYQIVEIKVFRPL